VQDSEEEWVSEDGVADGGNTNLGWFRCSRCLQSWRNCFLVDAYADRNCSRLAPLWDLSSYGGDALDYVTVCPGYAGLGWILHFASFVILFLSFVIRTCVLNIGRSKKWDK
jgi:hypothetical protein